MTILDKSAIRDAAVLRLEQDLETLLGYAEKTRKEATHAEAKPENDKDTRGLEQSYLARGQAKRAEEVGEAIRRLHFLDIRNFENKPVDLGAVVRLLVDDVERFFFLVPVGGGIKVEVDGTPVTLINPASPVGRALVGKQAGDDFELKLRGELRLHEVEDVW